ncbi:MAG: protein TonB [Celeribacter sp.]|jgi:protein TonB
MSLAYRASSSLWPVVSVTLGLSVAAHVAAPVLLQAQTLHEVAEIPREDIGIQGAIMFDLSDLIAAPSAAGEDSVAAAEAVDAPTVTESPEAVDPAKSADEPLLNQTPYEVKDDTLKFGIATPDSENDIETTATETASEFIEEQVDQASSLGATAAEASQASVSGIDAEAKADTAQASSEGLSADQMQEVSEWQKAVVLRIAKAKTYPSQARKQGRTGEVRVTFTIDRYGVIIARDVAQSSGWDVLDQAALKVFDDLEKLPTPPNHLHGDSFTLVIPLNYRINAG